MTEFEKKEALSKEEIRRRRREVFNDGGSRGTAGKTDAGDGSGAGSACAEVGSAAPKSGAAAAQDAGAAAESRATGASTTSRGAGDAAATSQSDGKNCKSGTETPTERMMRLSRTVFASGATRPAAFRKQSLMRLRKAIIRNEKLIESALRQDLGKCSYESYMSEIGFVLDELKYVCNHLELWMKERPVLPSKMQLPALCGRSPEPYGCVLIMSPWNYPFMLTMGPLIGAIAAGNCVIVKPSAYSPATSSIIQKIVEETFNRGHVDCVTGGRKENADLLKQRFDYIFFTGSVSVGKLVMESASKHLTPVSLELGGKSPCIVDETADLKTAARRIVFGKYLNVGQTCVAPDYLFVHASVKDELLRYIRAYIRSDYGEKPLEDKTYGKIVNEKHFDRLLGLMDGEEIYYGGHYDRETLKIEPTVLDHITPESRIMQEEIFGPLLPVMTYRHLPEVICYVNDHEKPLALYMFSRSRGRIKKIMDSCSFGGGCINDTIVHLATSHMPFGGVGHSGMGGYHGKYSFDIFTHYRSMVYKCRLDVPMRFRPYDSWKDQLLRRIIK